jgi:hypothetical protein
MRWADNRFDRRKNMPEDDAIKRVIASLKCGSCGRSYREAGIDVIEHKEEVWFLKVVCPACHVRSLVAAIIREAKGAPIMTDLSAADLEKFRDAAAIGEDDLLEMHAFLKDFNGDVNRLLG